MRDEMNVSAIESEDRAEFARAQMDCVSSDRFKDGLCVLRRAGNYTQDLSGCRLLLERLLGLVEQAHVLDSDNRLSGERLEQGDLPVGKRSWLRPADGDCTDRPSLAYERNSKNAAKVSSAAAPLGAKSGSSSTSAIATGLHVKIARLAAISRPGGRGHRRRMASAPSVVRFASAAK